MTHTGFKTTAHFQDADGFYERLLDAHLGLSPAQSELLNARLILILANQIGDTQVLDECIALARQLPDDLKDGLPGEPPAEPQPPAR